MKTQRWGWIYFAQSNKISTGLSASTLIQLLSRNANNTSYSVWYMYIVHQLTHGTLLQMEIRLQMEVSYVTEVWRYHCAFTDKSSRLNYTTVVDSSSTLLTPFHTWSIWICNKSIASHWLSNYWATMNVSSLPKTNVAFLSLKVTLFERVLERER